MNTIFALNFIALFLMVYSAPITQSSQQVYGDYKRPHATGYPEPVMPGNNPTHSRRLLSIADHLSDFVDAFKNKKVFDIVDSSQEKPTTSEINMMSIPEEDISTSSQPSDDMMEPVSVAASPAPEEDMLYDVRVASN